MRMNASDINNNYGNAINNCVACSSVDVRYWNSKSYCYSKHSDDLEFKIYRCQECGTGFLNPPPSLDLINDIYKYSGHALSSPIKLKDILASEESFPNSTVDATRMVTKATKMCISMNKLALDVGSGYGFYTKELNSMGYSTISINPGAYENDVFKELNGYMPIPVMFGEYNDENQFDVILMSQVLEHIVYPIKTVNKVASMLSVGGIFACAVPNYNSFAVKALGVRDNSCLWVPEHVNYFTEYGLNRLFKRCGLEVIYTENITRIRYDAISRRINFIKKLSPILDLMVKKSQYPISYIFDHIGMGSYINIYAMKSNI